MYFEFITLMSGIVARYTQFPLRYVIGLDANLLLKSS